MPSIWYEVSQQTKIVYSAEFSSPVSTCFGTNGLIKYVVNTRYHVLIVINVIFYNINTYVMLIGITFVV